MNKMDIEERLINFSVLVIEITNEMPDKKAASHLSPARSFAQARRRR